MKRLLAAASAITVLALASQANAADLAARPVYTKAPEYVPVVNNWSGWYLGGNVGYGWGKNTTDTQTLPTNGLGIIDSPLSNNTTGVIGGGQFGYNWQMGSFLAGFEADFQGSGIKGSSQGLLADFPNGALLPADDFRSSSQSLSWFGTVRGRLGVTVTPSLLLYGTGGLAYGHVNATGDTFLNELNQHDLASVGATKTGWAAGAGLEWMFAPSWSAKVEYLHMDLGSVSGTGINTNDPATSVRYTFQNQFDTVRVGVNYHFH